MIFAEVIFAQVEVVVQQPVPVDWNPVIAQVAIGIPILVTAIAGLLVSLSNRIKQNHISTKQEASETKLENLSVAVKENTDLTIQKSEENKDVVKKAAIAVAQVSKTQVDSAAAAVHEVKKGVDEVLSGLNGAMTRRIDDRIEHHLLPYSERLIRVEENVKKIDGDVQKIVAAVDKLVSYGT